MYQALFFFPLEPKKQKSKKKNNAWSQVTIDVKFIFDSAHLELFSSDNILQIANVALQVVFLLFLPCF